MGWYYLYRISDGSLVSETENEPSSLPEGIAALEEATRKSQTHQWDASVPGWVEKPANRRIRMDQLWDRLTEAEQAAFYSLPPDDQYAAKVDAAIHRNKTLANGILNLDSPVVGGMLDLLVAAGVLTAERKEEVLT